MTKTLCSIGAGPHEALLELTRPTFARFAERHGYELRTTTVADPRRPPPWAKLPLLKDALRTSDLVVWIDADAAIVDDRDDIADAVAPEHSLALVQHAVHGEPIPNTGVMVLRQGTFADALLARLWNATRYLNHPWWENAAMLDALGYPVPEQGLRRWLPRRPKPSPFIAGTQFLGTEWNSIYGAMAERPRIVHCLGTPVEQRLRDLTAAIAG